MEKQSTIQEIRIGDLARLADVRKRTVHYYVARGLLEPPIGTGGGAVYTQAHVDKLLLIRQMTAQEMSLDDIRQELEHLSTEEIRARLGQSEPRDNQTLRSSPLHWTEPAIPIAFTPPDPKVPVQDQGLLRRLHLPHQIELFFPADHPEAILLVHKIKEYVEYLHAKR